MKIGVCFFMESKLGGAATQADDLVTAARRLGHEAYLLRFTNSSRARGLFDYHGYPEHRLLIDKRGTRFESPRLLVTSPKCKLFVSRFDILIFVGLAPHLTRHLSEDDFYDHYAWLYDVDCKKIGFFTDPFWKRMYPYAEGIVPKLDLVYAFAEAYRNSIVASGLSDDVLVCNFGSIAAFDRIKDSYPREDKIIWPHQWRSWKNPALLIDVAPLLRRKVEAYAASGGMEYYKLRRDAWEAYCRAVSIDHIKGGTPKGGKLEVFDLVPQSTLLDRFSRCKWMLDFTGMSCRTGKPLDKFIGNYQCVNIECMALGCVNFKYKNTISPHSQVPEDCVIPLPLTTDPREVASFVNKWVGPMKYDRVSRKAKSWSGRFDPVKVFNRDFIRRS